MATGIICLILIVVCVIGVRSTMRRFTYGCCGSGGDIMKKVACKDRDLSHYPYCCTITVEGMSCKNCANRVENAFHESENFYAKVNLGKQEAEVRMKEKVTEQELRRIIRKAGYTPGECVFHDAKMS